MKLKSIHVRSPKDDQDLSCFLMKNTDEMNEMDPEHAHEPVDRLIVNPNDELNPLQNCTKLSEDLLQATNELGSFLSKINTNEPQVLILNSPPRGTSGQDTINLEPELAFLQGNIILFNQNSKAKVAEKNVLNMFARKHFNTWYQLYKSARWNRIRLKKNMMKVWRRVVDDIEIPSDSTETFVDLMPRNPSRNQKQFNDPHHGNNPKVLIVDIESEDLSSFPPSFFHPQTQSLPLSPRSQQQSHQNKNNRAPIMNNKKPKTPVNRQIQQKQKSKHYLLPTEASQPHPLPQEPIYHITRSSPPHTHNSPAGQEEKTQVSSLSKASSSHYNLHSQLSMKYPNYHLINNYMKLYEQEEQLRQHEVPKPKKLFKSTTPGKSSRVKVTASSQHHNVSQRPEQQYQQPVRSRDPNSASSSSPHPLKQFKQIGFQNLNPQHLQFQLPEKTERQQQQQHFYPLISERREDRTANEDDRDGEDGDAVSVVSSLSSTSNTRRHLLQRTDKLNSSKQKLSRLNQQLRDEKQPLQSSTQVTQQTILVQQMTQIAPSIGIQQQDQRDLNRALQLEISPIYPDEINNTTTTSSLGNQFTSSTATNNYNNNNPASLSSLMFKNRNQFAHLLENGRDNVSICNIDSSSSLPNQIDYLSIEDKNNESDNSSLPTFGRKLKQKMQKYHSQPAAIEPIIPISSSIQQEELFNQPIQSSNPTANRRELLSSRLQQPLSSPVMIVPASLPERKLSFRGSIISVPAAIPVPVIQLGSPGEETVVTKENSPTHSNKLLPDPQANPLQSRLALIKHRIVQTNTKPTQLRQTTSPKNISPVKIELTSEANITPNFSPIPLTEKRKLQLMRRFFDHSRQLIHKSSYNWQLFEQSAYFHRLRLKKKYFKNLLDFTEAIVVEKEVRQYSNQKNRQSQPSQFKGVTQRKEPFGEIINAIDEHIWGDDSLAKAFHFQKWRKFLKRTVVWREKEEVVAHQLDLADKRSVLQHWLSFAQEHRQRNRNIQDKLQRSPLAKYYSPVANTIVSLASSLTQSPSMSRLFTSPETDAKLFSVVPVTASVAATAARRLSLSLDHPDEGVENHDDDDSFALSRDDHEPTTTTNNGKNSKENQHNDDDSSILFPFDDNDSIYLSVSSFSGSNHEDQPVSDPSKVEGTVKSSTTAEKIPIFTKKRFYSLFQCYQSTCYYQNYTKLKVIEKLLNFSIQNKWQRQLSNVMRRNYQKKLLIRIFQAWKEYKTEEIFARVYQTYDSDYESNYGSYDSNN